MKKRNVFTKITEGVGYISGDHECWCINDHPWCDRGKSENLYKDGIYPDEFVPLEVEDIMARNNGREPKVRYKVTFQVEFLDEDE
jgi:hypothetical protein